MLGKVLIAVAAFCVLVLCIMKLLDIASGDYNLSWLGFIGIILVGWLYFELIKLLFKSKKSKNEQK